MISGFKHRSQGYTYFFIVNTSFFHHQAFCNHDIDQVLQKYVVFSTRWVKAKFNSSTHNRAAEWYQVWLGGYLYANKLYSPPEMYFIQLNAFLQWPWNLLDIICIYDQVFNLIISYCNRYWNLCIFGVWDKWCIWTNFHDFILRTTMWPGTPLIPLWISNYIHYKVWHEITYPLWTSMLNHLSLGKDK